MSENKFEYHYDASVSRAYTLLTDPSYLAWHSRKRGASQVNIVRELAGDRVKLRRSAILSGSMPRFVRSIMSRAASVDGVIEWQPSGAGHRGDYCVSIGGGRATIAGCVLLAPSRDGGCLHLETFTVSSSVSFLRSRFESFLTARMHRNATADCDLIAKTLSATIAA